jgi:hypothetical protein
VPNCVHAAHHIHQSFESFRFQKTRGNRTAVSAGADHGQRRTSGNPSDATKQLRQRNMDRPLEMIVIPFLGRSHIQDEGTLWAIQGGQKIARSHLRNLERLVQVIGGDKSPDLVKSDACQLELSFALPGAYPELRPYQTLPRLGYEP